MKQLFAGITLLLLIGACSTKTTVRHQEQPADSAPDVRNTAYVIKEKINARTAPSVDSDIVKQLQDGQQIQILGNVDGWYKISDGSGHPMWARSDLIGPRHLSRTRMAAVFSDSVLPAFNAGLFVDKNELFRTIYLTLPEDLYNTPQQALERARRIGLAYQERVYPGAIEIRIMRPEKKELFERVDLSAIGNPDVPIPVIEYGYLTDFHEFNNEVQLMISVADSVPDAKLLGMARNISSVYGYPFTKAEIWIVTDTAERPSLSSVAEHGLEKTACRLYYMEDKNGELYQFDACKPL